MIKRFFIFILLSFLCIASFSAYSKISPKAYLRKVVSIIEKGDYVLGSREFYRLSRSSAFKGKSIQIRYTLGIAFLEMKLYHLASLQFVYVIKRAKGSYKEKAIEKLSFILDYFEDDQLFCPLSSGIKNREYPSSVRDRLNFYFGKCAFSKKEFLKALYHFTKVSAQSSSYNKALYYKALVYAEQNKVKQSVNAFRDLASIRKGITDTNRVAALMGLARVLYQGKKFEDSIKVYRSIPKDTVYFHDSLMENSWNYLRSGKFRSALSNFQTLHSAFYKNHYQPESLVLRSYVYLYICKYYEMEKVLNFFNAVYLPILKGVNKSLKWGSSYNSYVKAVLDARRNKAQGLDFSDGSVLPKVVMDRVFKNAVFRSLINYLDKLEEEKALLETFPAEWRKDRVGRNAKYILNRRIASTRKTAGREIRKILLYVHEELKRLSTSEQYLRYDMLKGKREFLKKKIAKKHLDKLQIDEKISRNYYIQNGYEYWPFDGEAWLDELGNYHYLGRQNCE